MSDLLEKTTLCEICHELTACTYTKRCTRCWELETRIKYDFQLARQILERIEKENGNS
jgi:hypothetical protein